MKFYKCYTVSHLVRTTTIQVLYFVYHLYAIINNYNTYYYIIICMMDNILRRTESYTGVYSDDIVIHSHTWSEHIQHLTETLRRLEEAGLTIKLKKCTFGASDCTYLGYEIGGGVLPERRKIQAIVEMARPQTKKDVRTFLGITGYYCRFIQNYATIAEPLTELTRKNLPESITWSKRAELAFQKLKEVLATAPIMRNPDLQ